MYLFFTFAQCSKKCAKTSSWESSIEVLRIEVWHIFWRLKKLSEIILPLKDPLWKLESCFMVQSNNNHIFFIHRWENKILINLMGLCHSRSKQRTDQGVLVLTLKFLALKNWFFPRKKYFLNFFDFCLLLFYATFQCGPYNIFKINF